jgi:hypothetical protein
LSLFSGVMATENRDKSGDRGWPALRATAISAPWRRLSAFARN